MMRSKLGETVTKSLNVTEVSAVSDTTKLNFWSIANPFLYRAEVRLFADGELCDSEIIETGFRKVGYDKDRGVLLNDVPVWLRGYAQRATNEWATIGIAPEWLKDVDAMLIKESNANHIRFMHVAGSKADVRSLTVTALCVHNLQVTKNVRILADSGNKELNLCVM